MKRKRLSIALVVTMAMSSVPFNVFAGDARPPQGEAIPGENQPRHIGYRVLDVNEWSPETDPYAELLRARIPLQDRNASFAPTQANPKLSTKTEFYNLTGDYDNYFFGSTPYNNEFSQYVYNFWQYTDYHGGWHGTTTQDVPIELFDPDANWWMRAFEFGIVNLPNAAYTNAAHKNGVKSVGALFIPRAGQPYSDLLKRDENGEFIAAKKLIEMKEYYGFDGYFINQETAIDSKDIRAYKEFTKALVDADVYVQWYDTIDDTYGRLTYQPSLIPSHSSYIMDDELGLVNHSVFMNYNWNSPNGWSNGDSTDQKYINATVKEANRKGIDPLETVFSGVEAGMGKFNGSHNSTRNMDVILDKETGNRLTSIATLGSDFVATGLDDDLGGGDQNRRAQDAYQWMIAERERMWYTGVKIDPTDTDEQPGYSRPDVGVKDASQWTGISRYIAERSVIDGGTFVTNFNTGHGMEYYVDGELSSIQEWSNIGIQDILPTWQWWIETDGTKLQVDFDYGDKAEKGGKFTYKQVGAYKGGSSLVVNGLLDADNFLRLYKTDLSVKDTSKATVTFYKVSKSDQSTMSLGLIFEDAPDVVEYVPLPHTGAKTNGFVTQEIDLGDYNGRGIAAMGLAFTPGETAVENYQMNIGEIKITDGIDYTPAQPSGFKVENAFNTNEVYLTWDMENYDSVKQYNIYAELMSGKEEFLGGVYDEIYYIKNLSPNVIKLKLKAVGADGTESVASEIDFRYADYIRQVEVVETENGLDINWNNPDIQFESIKLELSFTDGREDTYTKEVSKFTEATQFVVPVKDDDRYLLKLSTRDASGKVINTTSVAGKMKDIYSEPYNGEYGVVGSYSKKLNFDAPASKDWWHMYIYINEELQRSSKKYDDKICDYRIRGFHDLNDIKEPKVGDEVKVILEDYAGNFSEPTIFIHGEINELAIKELEPVEVETRVGVAPLLPEKVMATYVPKDEVTTGAALRVRPSYKKEEVAVTWDEVSEASYSQVGQFKVQGTVEGTELKAVCTVNVVDKLELTLNAKEVVEPGETFEVTIGTSGGNVNKPIYAGDVRVKYDVNLFELQNVVGADLTQIAGEKQLQDGTLRILTATEGGSQGKTDWITLTLKVKESVRDQKSSIRVDESLFVSIVDGESGVIKGDLGKKDITITKRPSFIPDAEDINQDNKVDITDLALVAYYYQANSSSDNWEQAKKADIDKDGRVNIKDLTMVANKILK